MDIDNQKALMAVSLAAALAVFSPRGTLVVQAADEPWGATASLAAALPVDTATGHVDAPSGCAGRIHELMMQYGGDGAPLTDIEAACAAGPAPPETVPIHQD
jgi:hypothetical protein